MPRLKKQGAFYSLVFSEKEAVDNELIEGTEFELFNATQGIWVLKAKEEKGKEKQSPEQVAEEKVLELIEFLPLKERVFGVFESKLNENELIALKKLIAEEKVLEFKLSDKYKKSIYKLRNEVRGKEIRKTEPKEKERQKEEKSGIKRTEAKKGQDECSSFSNELNSKFVIFSDDMSAKKFSQLNEKDLKDGSLKGMKCFDGSSCFIANELFRPVSVKITDFLDSIDKATLDEISKGLNTDKNLIRVAMEFLKEEGTILEKKKDLFRLIK
ncbi:MAG: hypothetical protein ABIA76_00855 [Candidatus Diapherotrites archaeon]